MDPMSAKVTASLFLLALVIIVIGFVIGMQERPSLRTTYGTFVGAALIIVCFVLAWNAAAVAW